MNNDTLQVKQAISLDPNGKYVLQFRQKLTPDAMERLQFAVREWQTNPKVPFLVIDTECEIIEVKLPRVLDASGKAIE